MSKTREICRKENGGRHFNWWKFSQSKFDEILRKLSKQSRTSCVEDDFLAISCVRMKSRREICFHFGTCEKKLTLNFSIFHGIISVSASLGITNCVEWVECWCWRWYWRASRNFRYSREIFVPFGISIFLEFSRFFVLQKCGFSVGVTNCGGWIDCERKNVSDQL